MSNIYIDVHQLVTVGPNNMNRGEDGAPKTVTFGGVKRARLSSQSQKAAVRKHFFEVHGDRFTAIRSRKIPRLMAAELRVLDPYLSEQQSYEIIGCAVALLTSPKTPVALKAVQDKIKTINANNASGTTPSGKSSSKGREKAEHFVPDLAATFMVSADQAKQFAAVVKQYLDSGVDFVGDSDVAKNSALLKELRASVDDGITPDIALFGRMFASNHSLDSAASVQTAHAFGVGAFVPEEDYFTAADDFAVQTNSPTVKRFKDEVGVSDSGADMLDRNQFTAGTMYRFSTLNFSHLSELMGDPDYAVEVTRQYLESFLRTLPGGAKNSYAQTTSAGTAVVSIRTQQPVNYVGAFEVPVSTHREAKEVLTAYAQGYERMFGKGSDDVTFAMTLEGQEDFVSALGADPGADNMDSILDAVAKVLTALSQK